MSGDDVSKRDSNKGWFGRLADRVSAIWRGWVGWLLRKIGYALFVLALLSILLAILFRFANPYLTYYYVTERFRLGEVERVWTPIEDFSPYMARAVVAAEDAGFCNHFGFDLEGIKAALKDTKRLRGGSTISQQVAKNVFLWQGRSWLRKGLEVWFTLLVELTWSKQRIIEVYLNIAEFDEGVFGAAAAGNHYFGVAPDRLSPLQSARLAAILPSPKKRSASRPTAAVKRRTGQIMVGADTILADGRAGCFQ